MEKKVELKVETDISATLFGPVIFLILTGMWAILYFEFINFDSCSKSDSNMFCLIVPIISWTTWLLSSLFFLFCCCIKIVKEKKIIDLLILLGYGSIYWFTIVILFD